MSDENPILSPDDVRDVVDRYRKRIGQHGVTFDSLNSGSIEKQRIRHEVHASAIRSDCPSVLDVGCGLGGFCLYLKDRGLSCSYTGYDIVGEYIEECRRQFREATFELRNIFTDGIEGEFDTVVMSQVLNNHYRASDNLEVMEQALSLAYSHSRVSVSVDMMSTYVDFRNPEVFYYPPEEIFRIAKSLARRVILRHDYRPFEFCIQLFHEAAKGYVH